MVRKSTLKLTMETSLELTMEIWLTMAVKEMSHEVPLSQEVKHFKFSLLLFKTLFLLTFITFILFTLKYSCVVGSFPRTYVGWSGYDGSQINTDVNNGNVAGTNNGNMDRSKREAQFEYMSNTGSQVNNVAGSTFGQIGGLSGGIGPGLRTHVGYGGFAGDQINTGVNHGNIAGTNNGGMYGRRKREAEAESEAQFGYYGGQINTGVNNGNVAGTNNGYMGRGKREAEAQFESMTNTDSLVNDVAGWPSQDLQSMLCSTGAQLDDQKIEEIIANLETLKSKPQDNQ